MPILLIASRNAHKAEEIAAILGDSFTVQTLAKFPAAPEVVENGDTFTANAVKKATEIAAWLGGQALGQAQPDFVLADDSGLEVDALGGAPGLHSARYTGSDGNAPDAANNAKLLRELDGVADGNRGAQFQCVLALTALGQAAEVRTFEGICRGRIAQAQTGQGGFGYDPLFVPDGHDLSFAELGREVKNTISHRARALAKLAEHFG
jgi:XTP/dITP diphosphohydrolase